ncbi:Hsp20/alpha crystallin family protein [Ancylostoma ceylanicum]|uniref:Hsp20/alpha crystallin family protein n=2 Tax=Ancylostoma ceylanicum TaxID=53326 RepID=A0A0D6LUQ4_9BILA|nr:Hsp20/alpha crystallin family protein [Ancylostoma ceylanicum]
MCELSVAITLYRGMERRIDVNRSNYSVIDNEFGNMRDRFEAEMRRVEDEMKRLRQEFEGYRPGAPPPAISNQAYNLSHSSQQDSRRQEGFGAPPSSFGHSDLMTRPTYDPYLDNLKSPLIKDESDGKTLRLRFDVAQYKPEEVTVKTIDNRLLVHAKHEEKTPQRTVFREYNQEFLLPRGTNPEQISSTLSTDGVLTVEAPLPHLAIQQ